MSVKQVFNTSAELDYPTVLPTLDLDFANSKTLDSRITFTRASGGSYVGADGLIKYAGVNEPRFDHDPVTGESLGLLVEESRTNYHYDSYSSSPNIYTPDGLLSSNYTTQNFTNSGYTSRRNRIQFNQVLSPGTTYTFSMYIRYYGSPNLGPKLNIGDYTGDNYGYTTVMIQYSSYDGENFNVIENLRVIEVLQNDWYRVALTFNGPISSSSTTVPYVYMGGYSSLPELPNFGIQMWQPQLEVGAFATSHIPPSRTRAADNASITGKNFSSWYNQSEGTLLWKGIFDSYNSSGSNDALFAITDGSVSNRFSIRPRNTLATSSGNTLFESFDWGYTVQSNTYMNGALAIKSGDYALVTSGAVRNTSSSLSVPQVNRIENFNSIEGGYSVTGIIHHQRITYYPKRLTNQQLQVLTT